MTDPVIQVQDEWFLPNGDRVYVVSAYANGDLKVGLPFIRTGPLPDDYLYLAVSPTTTVSALRAILALIGVTLP